MNKKLVVVVLLVIVLLAFGSKMVVEAANALELTWVLACEDGQLSTGKYAGKQVDFLKGFGKCKVLLRPGGGVPAAKPTGDTIIITVTVEPSATQNWGWQPPYQTPQPPDPPGTH